MVKFRISVRLPGVLVCALANILNINSCLCFGDTADSIQALPEISTNIEPLLQRDSEQEQENIYRHNDIYFLFGRPNTKLQLSFKLKPMRNFELYFSYTEILFWKVTESSAPFSDINFQPELFYDWTTQFHALKAIRFGLEHRSNGRDGVESRSFDRVFVETQTQLGYGTYRMRWDLRLFWVYDYDWKSDSNMRRYMGVWESRMILDSFIEQFLPAKGEIYLKIHPGQVMTSNLERGGIEFGIKYRLRLFHIMPYLMFQYYYGSMESLLSYQKVAQSYRFGFTL